ncbi:MAG: hypothetical protein EPO09_17420 [Aquabacterium sp.]|uniref:hypothetical protein n=1 Tax=Aquabacterium sp. TaxID=1872578 RepID=UPI00120EDCA5|nr:hypothetical protein [Aquabacterium sp.]TAK89411.1 MAG: hypothetical protein EPO09_17420 [Aquabacterium sp.]
MSRLQSQLHRLYGVGEQPLRLIDDHGQVRAMVMTLGQPADWSQLSAVWQGVQADFGLPAPAIAVNGKDAYQLWFSLQTPVHASQAAAFMVALQARYLAAVPPHRVHTQPVDAATHDAQLPPVEVQGDQWTAFLAPDLAPMFNDTPWLDLPPNREGQADLLSKVNSITALDLDAAMARLTVSTSVPLASTIPASQTTLATQHGDPRQFLLSVMNNETVALHLRIEAAKALLPFEPRQ